VPSKPVPENALRKTGIVVAFGNQIRAAFAGVEDNYPAAVTREIDRCREAGGAAANDQAVVSFRVGQIHENVSSEVYI
jgi:hypothetical protein